MKSIKKGFTLVELIVVITILAILGTISFISLVGYSKEARDAKRITEANSLLGKVNIEMTRGYYSLPDLITNTTGTTLQILGNTNFNVKTFGNANFDVLKEAAENFKDPLNKTQDYPMAYAIGGSGSGSYKFVQIATISEKENKTRILGNYFMSKPGDALSLFKKGTTEYTDNGSDLVYNLESLGGNGENNTIKYTINFDTLGGNPAIPSITNISKNQEVTLPGSSVTSKDGYKVTAWTDNTNDYEPGSKIIVTGNMILYPRWTEDAF